MIKKDEFLDRSQQDVDKEAEELKKHEAEINQAKAEVARLGVERARELERVAKLSEGEAKEELLAVITKNYEEDLVARARKLESANNEALEYKAKNILATTIQRLATSTVPEMMSTIVEIPSDDVKGKIIGKEGRNIRAFEKATGVEVIIDDTPGTIVLSSFDPVRRQIAKVAMDN